MPDHYDRLESRTASSRESALFRDLRHVLSISRPRAPALRAQLKGVDVTKLTTRNDLSQIPLIRRSDYVARQADLPPFGGINTLRLGGLKQSFVSSGPFLSIEGHARDWWGMGRALFGAGLRKGTLVINCFAYDLVPDGHMVSSGAADIGCPVIPAGVADLDRKLDAIARLAPGFFCGRSDELKTIIDHAADGQINTTCIKDALVTGPTQKGRRSEFALRGFNVRHVFMLPELGAVAYETDAHEAMTIGEGYIVEIVDPASGIAVGPGESGELVVTRINIDCPILRYATGLMSSVVTRPSGCGRTNMRIATPTMSSADFVDTDGHRIHIADIREIGKRHPTVTRLSLAIRRLRERDVLHLRVEHSATEVALIEDLSETLHLVTRMPGTVELVAPGTLSEDDPMIVDERHLN